MEVSFVSVLGVFEPDALVELLLEIIVGAEPGAAGGVWSDLFVPLDSWLLVLDPLFGQALHRPVNEVKWNVL